MLRVDGCNHAAAALCLHLASSKCVYRVSIRALWQCNAAPQSVCIRHITCVLILPARGFLFLWLFLFLFLWLALPARVSSPACAQILAGKLTAVIAVDGISRPACTTGDV